MAARGGEAKKSERFKFGNMANQCYTLVAKDPKQQCLKGSLTSTNRIGDCAAVGPQAVFCIC
jgi:hypothetical protein